VQVRTLLAVGALFAGSVLAADRIALSLATFTDAEPVQGNTFQTSSLATPTGFGGSVSCTFLLRSNDLSWNSVANATGYVVERAVGVGEFLLLAAPSGTSYSDQAVAGGTYRYRVSASLNLWTSSPTPEVTLVQPGFCL
jgi:hypothetical protein